ncbi:MAG: MFS transporter [Candidatus Njordarchaeia archaeon]
MGVPIGVYILSFGVFIIMLGFGFLMPFFPLFARDLGATTIDIGWLVSIFMITRALLARYFGSLSDRISNRKIVIVLGSFAYGALMIAFALARNVIDLYAIRALQGVASAAYWPVAEALIADMTPQQYRGRAMGIYMTSNNMAFFIGPGLAGLLFLYFHDISGLTELLSFRYSFIIGGVIAFISTAVIYIGVREPSEEEKHDIERINREFVNSKIGLKTVEIYDASVALLAFYIMAIANGFAMGMSMPITVLYLSDYLHASPSFISFILSISGVFNLIAAYPAGWLSDIVGRRGVIVIGMLGSRAASIIMALTIDKYVFGSIMVARSFFFNVASPSFRALQADIVTTEIRGKVFGTVQAFFNIGSIFGPIIGTYLYSIMSKTQFRFRFVLDFVILGPAVNFIISGLLGLFSLAIFIVLVKPK